jgi:hypothetical protein
VTASPGATTVPSASLSRDGEDAVATARASLLRTLATTRFTLREARHGRGFLVGTLLSLVWLAVPALIGWASFSYLGDLATQLGGGPDAQDLARRVVVSIVVGVAIGGLSFIAVLVTIFRGAGSIAADIQRGTILAVAARPIARVEIVIGTVLGISLVAAIVFTTLATASVVVAGQLSGVWITEAWQSILLLDLNLLIVGAVAVAASTRFSPLVATVAVLATYFGITNIDKLYAFGQFSGSQPLQQAAVWGRLLLPVGEVSDLAAEGMAGPLRGVAASLVRGELSGFDPRPWIVAYAIGYLLVVVGVAGVALSRRDLR